MYLTMYSWQLLDMSHIGTFAPSGAIASDDIDSLGLNALYLCFPSLVCSIEFYKHHHTIITQSSLSISSKL